MRLVLDTSIVVSAIRSDAGASRFLVSAALRRSFELLISVPLALEYEAVMHRPEHLSASGLTHEEVEIVLGSLLSVGREISLGKFLRPNLTDPGDEHILNLALRGAADGLVTQNLRHFLNLQQKFGVKLYSPQEAIRLLRK